MTWLEIAAVAFCFVNVVLIVARSVWNYPFGLVMVALYAIVFLDAKLYANTALQMFFFVVQLYGWVVWLRHRDAQGLVKVERLSGILQFASGIVAVALIGALGWWFAHYTDDPAPWPDAAIAALSIVGQTLLSLRKIETWAFWIAVDLVAIALFTQQHLYLSSGLYFAFLCLSILGGIGWWRTLRSEGTSGGPVAA